MKTLRLVATLALLGTLTLGMAEDVTAEPAENLTVDEQITAIINATPEERVDLVNDFKVTLSTLSDEERAAAIDQLRSSIEPSADQVQMQAQTQTQTRQRSRINQMEQTESVQAVGSMVQQEVPGQVMQQGGGAPIDTSIIGGHRGGR